MSSVKHVVIDGNEYPVSASIESMLWAAKEIGRPLADMLINFSTMHEYDTLRVMYAFMKFGAEYSKRPPLTFSEFSTLLMRDKNAMNELNRVLELLSDDLAKELNVSFEEKKY